MDVTHCPHPQPRALAPWSFVCRLCLGKEERGLSHTKCSLCPLCWAPSWDGEAASGQLRGSALIANCSLKCVNELPTAPSLPGPAPCPHFSVLWLVRELVSLSRTSPSALHLVVKSDRGPCWASRSRAPQQPGFLTLPGPTSCPNTYSFSSSGSPRKEPFRSPVILLLLKSLEDRGEHRGESVAFCVSGAP